MSNIQPQGSNGEQPDSTAAGQTVVQGYYFSVNPIVTSMFYATVVFDPQSNLYNTQLYYIVHGKPEYQRILLFNACLELNIKASIDTLPYVAPVVSGEKFRVESIPSAQLGVTLLPSSMPAEELKLRLDDVIRPQWTVGEGDISIIDPQIPLCTEPTA